MLYSKTAKIFTTRSSKKAQLIVVQPQKDSPNHKKHFHLIITIAFFLIAQFITNRLTKRAHVVHYERIRRMIILLIKNTFTEGAQLITKHSRKDSTASSLETPSSKESPIHYQHIHERKTQFIMNTFTKRQLGSL